MRWTRVGLGAAVGAAGLAVLYLAWEQGSILYWIVGGLALFSAVLFIAAGLPPREAPQELAEASARYQVQEAAPDRRPLIGELLVYKYRRISSETLEQALDFQRGTTKTLGEILLSMREISQSDLDLVLADQERYKDGSWVTEPWAQRRLVSMEPARRDPASRF